MLWVGCCKGTTIKPDMLLNRHIITVKQAANTPAQPYLYGEFARIMAISTSTITINAEPANVWQALTDPKYVKLWQYGSDLITDWQPGNPIRFRTEWNGQVFEQWGTVRDFQPGSKLSYTLFAPRPDLEDRPENYFLMTYILTPVDGSTLLKIIQEDNRPGSAGRADETDESGENEVLKALKNVAETIS